MASVGRPRLYPDIQTTWRENQRTHRKAKQAQIKVYHRSKRADWGTPQEFFDPLHVEFGFTLDVAASSSNTKCLRYFTHADDGLRQPWAPNVCWMNPPYGRGIEQWREKAYDSAQVGATVVCLVKATPDTQWWHTYAPYAEIRFVVGRLTFVGATNRAPFPSALLIFRPPREESEYVYTTSMGRPVFGLWRGHDVGVASSRSPVDHGPSICQNGLP